MNKAKNNKEFQEAWLEELRMMHSVIHSNLKTQEEREQLWEATKIIRGLIRSCDINK
jgi:hypothetical protein